MDNLITAITSFFTAFLGWLGSILSTVENQPLLLVFVMLAIAGIVSRQLRKWLPGL